MTSSQLDALTSAIRKASPAYELKRLTEALTEPRFITLTHKVENRPIDIAVANIAMYHDVQDSSAKTGFSGMVYLANNRLIPVIETREQIGRIIRNIPEPLDPAVLDQPICGITLDYWCSSVCFHLGRCVKAVFTPPPMESN